MHRVFHGRTFCFLSSTRTSTITAPPGLSTSKHLTAGAAGFACYLFLNHQPEKPKKPPAPFRRRAVFKHFSTDFRSSPYPPKNQILKTKLIFVKITPDGSRVKKSNKGDHWSLALVAGHWSLATVSHRDWRNRPISSFNTGNSKRTASHTILASMPKYS